MITCKNCQGHGSIYTGKDYYTKEVLYEECLNCNGLGYLPLLGWAVLASTYGSQPNTIKRIQEYWIQALKLHIFIFYNELNKIKGRVQSK